MSELSRVPEADFLMPSSLVGLVERFAAVIESLPGAILCINRDWCITYANPEAIRISRLFPELFPTVPFFELFADVLGTELETRFRAAMVSGARDHFEFYYPRFDVWLDVHLLPTDEGFAAFYSDITAAKKTEIREAAITRQVRQVFEAISDGVVIVDKDWRFSFANQRALELVGKTEIVGHNIFELFPGNNEEPFGSSYRTTMALRVATEFEAFHTAPLNLWLKVQAKPFALNEEDEGIIIFFSDISERKHAELREKETARRLAQTLEVTSDAVATLDREWRYTFLNSNAHALIDPERRLLGKNIWEEFPLAASGPAWEIYHRSMNENIPGTAEIYYPEPVNAWLHLQSEPTPEGIVIFFRDITEQRLHDAVVRGQQDLLASVQEVARLATWELDFVTGQLAWGPGSVPVLGYPLEEMTTREARHRIMLPGHGEHVREVFRQAAKTGENVQVEFAVKAADGSVVWAETRGQLVPGTEANPRMRGMTIDITRRKRNEEELLEEQTETERRRAELETIYHTTPIGLALLDPVEFRFLNLNDQEAGMLGYPKEYLLGRRLTEIAPPDKLPGMMEMIRSAAAGKVVKDRLLEGELAARPGEQRAWRVNYSPIRNEDGSVRAISTASIEITNQKKAEAALIQSEKLAAVGRLASSISHEINNPLEAITNLLYLIAMEEELPAPVRGYVNMAQSELSRVSQIATQTLRFHRQAVAPTPVSAQELVAAVVRLYTGRLANSSITVDARYATDAKILCFENDIRQVLNNLIANAIDAMRNGGQLMIRAHNCRDQAGRGGIRITIADTGHGMGPAVLGRVFEPFFTTKDLNGTGLGLWISAGIVERHQGRLRVRSSDEPERHGTVFTLFLPFKKVDDVA